MTEYNEMETAVIEEVQRNLHRLRQGEVYTVKEIFSIEFLEACKDCLRQVGRCLARLVARGAVPLIAEGINHSNRHNQYRVKPPADKDEQ